MILYALLTSSQLSGGDVIVAVEVVQRHHVTTAGISQQWPESAVSALSRDFIRLRLHLNQGSSRPSPVSTKAMLHAACWARHHSQVTLILGAVHEVVLR
jgi:hypothetical protein